MLLIRTENYSIKYYGPMGYKAVEFVVEAHFFFDKAETY